MKSRSEGIRRLSLLAGILGAVVTAGVLYMSGRTLVDFTDPKPGVTKGTAIMLERLPDGRDLYLLSDGTELAVDPKRLEQVETEAEQTTEPTEEVGTDSETGYYGPGFVQRSFLAAIAVVVGFLVPWGIAQVVGWVILGFVIDWRGREQ